jgi:hypothetical protein
LPDVPKLTPIFHITAIDNLPSIALQGGLLAKSRVAALGVQAADIAYQQIQGRRAVKAVPLGPGGNLHDYVPFYFAPRSPMLKTIDGGNVAGCRYRQRDIVHLRTSVERVIEMGGRYVFSNANAAIAIVEFFNDIIRLDEVDWSLLLENPRIEGYCKYWNNRADNPRYVRRMEKRMAEFLVHDSVPLGAIDEIGVLDQAGHQRVADALAGTEWRPQIRVVPGWYH